MKKIKGFTLTEVIITMVLVILLSLISMPIYRGRYSNNAKLAEGYALLGTIREAQMSYYNEYGYFLCANESFAPGAGGAGGTYISSSYTCLDPVLGISAVNNKYFTSFNYDSGATISQQWRYQIHLRVRSAKAGTIMQLFNLTERHDITVIGGNTNLNI